VRPCRPPFEAARQGFRLIRTADETPATRGGRRCYRRRVSLADLSGLLDEGSRRFLPYFIADRFADAREPDECHLILRFCQLVMWGNAQVTLQELREHVREPKLAALEALIAAIRSSDEDVSAWFAWATEAFPVIPDRPSPPASEPIGHEASQ
jgi:hypothetical protein